MSKILNKIFITILSKNIIAKLKPIAFTKKHTIVN